MSAPGLTRAPPATGGQGASRAGEQAELAKPASAAGDSLTVAAWTVVSRVTGLARVAVIGAVLGPTYSGNTYQFTNTLPNLLYYGFLAGGFFSSLLAPALVRHIDIGNRRASERVAGGFLGPEWFGSSATDELTGLGPGPLGPGDLLHAAAWAPPLGDHLAAGCAPEIPYRRSITKNGTPVAPNALASSSSAATASPYSSLARTRRTDSGSSPACTATVVSDSASKMDACSEK